MTIYHTIFEIVGTPTPEKAKALSNILESNAAQLYPEGYSPAEVLPGVETHDGILSELAVAFQEAIDVDGLESCCIEARRAVYELMEKIGAQL